MMDQNRLNMENMVLNYYMGGSKAYQFGGIGTSYPYLRIAAQTMNNKIYVLNMDLRGFPESKPDVYVECTLKDYYGMEMTGPSRENHTLTANNKGWTQICHYHPSAWRTDLSLWLVYLKCMVWLNMYEQTLRTGNTMEYYLRHQGGNDVY